MNNILITSAGRRVSLVRMFKKELKRFFPEAKLYTADADPSLSAACQESDGAFKVMKNDDGGYIDELLSLARRLDVKIIIPTIDTGLQNLADHQELFEREGIKVMICSSNLIETCRDKRKTSSFFLENGIDTPALYDKNALQFPLFIKPYNGSMSVDTFHITSEMEITAQHLINDKLMFMEYIDSSQYDEFTIDMYYGKDHKLKCLVPRKRLEVRGGEINKGLTVKNFVFEYLKQKLSHINGAIGCLTLQLFYNEDNQAVKAIEINPRFGGGYPLSYLSGANYPEYIIREYLMNEQIVPFNDWEDDLLMLRYDDEVLVHGANL